MLPGRSFALSKQESCRRLRRRGPNRQTTSRPDTVKSGIPSIKIKLLIPAECISLRTGTFHLSLPCPSERTPCSHATLHQFLGLTEKGPLCPATIEGRQNAFRRWWKNYSLTHIAHHMRDWCVPFFMGIDVRVHARLCVLSFAARPGPIMFKATLLSTAARLFGPFNPWSRC